jgi:type VI secretion system protein ImpG
VVAHVGVVVGHEDTRAIIDGLTQVSSRPATGRVPSAVSGGICRGLEALLEFDAQQYHGSSVFLFASVLERFLGLYCSINSFVRTTASIRGKEGVLRRWPPRAGDQTLL